MKSKEELAEQYFGKVVSDVIFMLAPYRNNLEVMRKLYAVIPAYVQGYISTLPPPQQTQRQQPAPAAAAEIIEFRPLRK